MSILLASIPGDNLMWPVTPCQSRSNYLDYQDRNQSFSGILVYKVLSVGIGIDKSAFSSWGNAAPDVATPSVITPAITELRGRQSSSDIAGIAADGVVRSTY
jgi:hypothetical protein